MAEQSRLRGVAIATLAAVLAGLGIVEALDQFGASPLLPALFPALPIGIALLLAFRVRSLAFADIVRGGRPGSRAQAFASAGVGLSALSLVAAPAATALGGRQGLALLAAFVLGMLAATLIVMPGLRSEGVSSLAEAIGRRFGRGARAVAAVAILFILLPLLAAEISLAGMVGARMLGVPAALGREIMVGLALVAGLVGGLGAAIVIAAVMLPIAIAAFIAPVGIVSMGESAIPLPWIGLFDPATLGAGGELSPLVLAALCFSLTVGVAALPTLMFPAWNATRRRLARLDFTLPHITVALVLLAAPSYAVYGRIAGIDADADPFGLVIGFPDHVGLSATPSVLLIAGLLAAGLADAVTGLVTSAIAIGHDLYGPFAERRTPDNRRVFIARLAMIVIAVGLVLFFRRPGSDNIALLAGVALSMSAATLGPVLLFGGLIRHHRGVAGTGAMIVGLWLTTADIVLALGFPQFGSVLGMKTVTPSALGPTGWFGLPVGLSGMIGFVCGTIALVTLSLVPRLPWRLTWIRLLIAARHLRRGLRRLQPKRAPVAAPIAIQPAPAAAILPRGAIDFLPPLSTPETLPVPVQSPVIVVDAAVAPVLTPALAPVADGEPSEPRLTLPAPEPTGPASTLMLPAPEPVLLLTDETQAPAAAVPAPRPKWRHRRRPISFPRVTPPRRNKRWRRKR